METLLDFMTWVCGALASSHFAISVTQLQLILFSFSFVSQISAEVAIHNSQKSWE